jgi:hypothetical protein
MSSRYEARFEHCTTGIVAPIGLALSVGAHRYLVCAPIDNEMCDASSAVINDKDKSA